MQLRTEQKEIAALNSLGIIPAYPAAMHQRKRKAKTINSSHLAGRNLSGLLK